MTFNKVQQRRIDDLLRRASEICGLGDAEYRTVYMCTVCKFPWCHDRRLDHGNSGWSPINCACFRQGDRFARSETILQIRGPIGYAYHDQDFPLLMKGSGNG